LDDTTAEWLDEAYIGGSAPKVVARLQHDMMETLYKD